MGSLLEMTQLFHQDHTAGSSRTGSPTLVPAAAADPWAPWVLPSAVAVPGELGTKVHLPAKKRFSFSSTPQSSASFVLV